MCALVATQRYAVSSDAKTIFLSETDLHSRSEALVLRDSDDKGQGTFDVGCTPPLMFDNLIRTLQGSHVRSTVYLLS